jgi:hypothetical protein
MMAQASFDELIAFSLAALDQACTNDENVGVHLTERFHQNVCGGGGVDSSFCTSTNDSIDDFLEDYRHELESICEFMSCADDAQTASKQMFCEKSEDSVPFVPSVDVPHWRASDLRPCGTLDQSSKSSTPKQESKTSPNGCFQRVHTTPSIALLGLDISRKERNDEDPHTSKRARRLGLSAEKREERRRTQNREAQRRYREKNMLLAHRQDSS